MCLSARAIKYKLQDVGIRSIISLKDEGICLIYNRRALFYQTESFVWLCSTGSRPGAHMCFFPPASYPGGGARWQSNRHLAFHNTAQRHKPYPATKQEALAYAQNSAVPKPLARIKSSYTRKGKGRTRVLLLHIEKLHPLHHTPHTGTTNACGQTWTGSLLSASSSSVRRHSSSWPATSPSPSLLLDTFIH